MVRDPRLAWMREEKPFCRGVERIPLDEAQRLEVRALCPADRPHLWFARADEEDDVESKIIGTARHTSIFRSGLFTYHLSNTMDHRGEPVAVFPSIPDVALSRVDRQVGSVPDQVDIAPSI